jgi:hypothetical protein
VSDTGEHCGKMRKRVPLGSDVVYFCDFVLYELSRTGKDYWLHQKGVLSIRSHVSVMMIAFAIFSHLGCMLDDDGDGDDWAKPIAEAQRRVARKCTGGSNPQPPRA